MILVTLCVLLKSDLDVQQTQLSVKEETNGLIRLKLFSEVAKIRSVNKTSNPTELEN